MKLKLPLLIFIILFLGLKSIFAQYTIPQTFYGQNAWYSYYNSTSPSADPLTNTWTEIKKSGAQIVRIGGNDFNLLNNPPVTTAKIVELIDIMRSKGIEPLLSVSYPNSGYNNANVNADAAVAANLVKDINTTTGPNGSTFYRNVKYWTIANEPDQCITCPSSGVQQGYNYSTSADIPKIALYMRTFSIAMKKIDPNIKIVGPELSSYINNIYSGLFVNGNGAGDDISGLIPNIPANGLAANLPYVDYISVHIYPNNFGGATSTANRTTLQTQLQIPETTSGSLRWQLKQLKDKATLINTNASRINSPIKVIVTESNVDYVNENSTTLLAQYKGNDNRSFIGGQWWAEWMSVLLQYNVEWVNFWSAKEDPNGYIDGAGLKRSSYWHFNMMANNFKKNLYTPTLLSGASADDIKTFASKSGDRIAVLVMNQNTTTDYDFSVDLNGGNSGGTGAVKISFPSLAANTVPVYHGDGSNTTTLAKIENQSTVLLVYDCRGFIVERKDYKLSGVIAALPTPNTYAPSSNLFSTVLIGNTIFFTGNNVTVAGGCTNVVFNPSSYNYVWQVPCGNALSGNSVNLCQCAPAGQATTYTFSATDPATGCVSTQEFIITDAGIITGTPPPGQWYAYLASVGPSNCYSKTGSASYGVSPSGPYSSSWDNGPYVAGTSTIGLAAGPHTVSIKTGAINSSNPSVVKYFSIPSIGPLPSVYAGPDQNIGQYCVVTLAATPAVNTNSYQWYKGNSTTPFSNVNSTPFYVWSGDVYTVKMTTPGGCTATDQVNVTAILPRCHYPGFAGVTSLDPCPPATSTERNGSPPIKVINSAFSINSDQNLNNVYIVTNTGKLSITNCELALSAGSKIIVQPGGQLIINNAYLHGCGFYFWEGLEVNGNNNDPNQLSITGSVIENAYYPVKTDKTIGVYINDNTFNNGTTAITLDRNKDFTISNNYFFNFTTGIHTSRTPIADVRSLIKENFFEGVKVAISFDTDNHSKLDVVCNRFNNYTDYAIYSNNTTLKDQGALTSGAANSFVSSSTMLNHQLRHNGNAMKYYYDPSSPVSLTTGSGLMATAQVAGADGACSVVNARFAGGPAEVKIEAGVNEINLSAFPNPFTDQLTITYQLPVKSKTGLVRIYESGSGRVVFEATLNNTQNKIVLDQFNIAAGLYICQVITEDGTSKQFKLVNIK